MAAEPVPPAALHPELVKRLLDNLETNDDFRATFQADPEKALRSLMSAPEAYIFNED